jgi:hypothetical protein
MKLPFTNNSRLPFQIRVRKHKRHMLFPLRSNRTSVLVVTVHLLLFLPSSTKNAVLRRQQLADQGDVPAPISAVVHDKDSRNRGLGEVVGLFERDTDCDERSVTFCSVSWKDRTTTIFLSSGVKSVLGQTDCFHATTS